MNISLAAGLALLLAPRTLLAQLPELPAAPQPPVAAVKAPPVEETLRRLRDSGPADAAALLESLKNEARSGDWASQSEIESGLALLMLAPAQDAGKRNLAARALGECASAASSPGVKADALRALVDVVAAPADGPGLFAIRSGALWGLHALVRTLDRPGYVQEPRLLDTLAEALERSAPSGRERAEKLMVLYDYVEAALRSSLSAPSFEQAYARVVPKLIELADPGVPVLSDDSRLYVLKTAVLFARVLRTPSSPGRPQLVQALRQFEQKEPNPQVKAYLRLEIGLVQGLP